MPFPPFPETEMNNQAAQTMPVIDDFNGDNAKLIESARALISLSDSGSLAHHGIGGHARAILSAFIVRTEAAALSQTAGVVVSDEMIERACKDYALRVDGALWPDAYDEHEVLALRAQMREFLLNAIGAAPAASGGEDA